MLLRSSSTPVLGSLLSSISDSPSHESSTPNRHFPSNSFYPNHTRLSFCPSPGSLHLSTTVSCGSSPVSPSVVVVDQFSDFDRKIIRRAQSEGNLEGLVHSACDSYSNDEFYHQNQPSKHLPARHNRLMLETIPSFSFYNSRARCEEEEEENDDDESEFEEEEEEEEKEEVLESSEERVMGTMNGGHESKTISREELKVRDNMWNVGFGDGGLVGQEMFLAKGLGTDDGHMGGFGGCGSGGGGGGGDGEFINTVGSGGDGGDKHEVEQCYKRMVEENPGNPLFLGNYAQFLYQSKGDLERAEEYYGRAILADAKDGETLSQYAKLVWELHHDQERASTYFERAVQASPQDSHVHAAYASFLWETEEDEDECTVPSNIDSKPPQFHEAALASA